MWDKLLKNTDVTQEEILQRINIQAYPKLQETIEEATRLDTYINHITGRRYDTASAEFKEFAQTLVPPDHWNTIVPPDWVHVHQDQTGSSSGSQSANVSGEWSSPAAPGNASPNADQVMTDAASGP